MKPALYTKAVRTVIAIAFPSFVTQQVGVPIAAILILRRILPWMVPALPQGDQGPFSLSDPVPPSRFVVLFLLLIAAATGVLCATLAPRYIAAFRRPSQWIWLIPTLVVVFATIADWIEFSLRKALSELLLPADRVGWLTFVTFTGSTAACIAYSLAARFTSKPAVPNPQ